MIIIGEKINGTRKSVLQAIKDKDIEFIKDLALRQTESGANYLDVNAGTHPNKEPEDITWLVNTVQSVSDVTLCIDSPNPKALEAGIKAANKIPMLNSLSGEKKRVKGVLPLACKYKTELIVLAMDDRGIPKTEEDRIEIVRDIVKMTREGGLPDEKLFIDPLVSTIAMDTGSGQIAFNTIRSIKKDFPLVHITAGLSNISFGMPGRTFINQAFAVLAIAAGLDSAIINSEDRDLRTITYAAELVLGMDRHCLTYNRAYRAGKIGTPTKVKARG